MSLQPGNAPSRRNGPLWSKMAHGLEMAILAENTSFSWFVARAQNITTTVHFVGLGRFQAVSPSREHVLHAPDVRSDIRSRPWRRCSHLYSHPGTAVGVNSVVNTYATGAT